MKNPDIMKHELLVNLCGVLARHILMTSWWWHSSPSALAQPQVCQANNLQDTGNSGQTESAEASPVPSNSPAQGQTHWGIPAEFIFTSGLCRGSLSRGYTKGQVSHWTWEPPHLLTLITIWMDQKMELGVRGRHRSERVQAKWLIFFRASRFTFYLSLTVEMYRFISLWCKNTRPGQGTIADDCLEALKAVLFTFGPSFLGFLAHELILSPILEKQNSSIQNSSPLCLVSDSTSPQRFFLFHYKLSVCLSSLSAFFW